MKLALCDARGLLNEFLDRLSGDKASEWIDIFKSVFRKDFDVQAVVEKLGGVDGVRFLLSNQLVVRALDLLAQVATIKVSAFTKFVAKDHIKLDTSKKAKVKVGYLSDNLTKNFLGKVEENIPATTLAAHTLKKASLDGPILAELGNHATTTLAHFWELLTKQGRGQDGVLLTNGYWNIFYILDEKGTRWAVIARWGAFCGGWDVYAYAVDDPRRWHAGGRVFSRDSEPVAA